MLSKSEMIREIQRVAFTAGFHLGRAFLQVNEKVEVGALFKRWLTQRESELETKVLKR